LVVVMILTEILAALITSKAAGLVMFPIAAAAGAKLGIPHSKILIALMMGASDYTTPQGHQINLMIMSPGAYRFTDYQKLGIPLEICLNVFQVVCLYFIDYTYVTIPVAFVFLVCCIAFDHVFVEGRPFFSLSLFHPVQVARAVRGFVAGLVPVVPISLRRHDRATHSRNVVERLFARWSPFRAQEEHPAEPMDAEMGHEVIAVPAAYDSRTV